VPDFFTLDKLRELCEKGKWLEAEDEAENIRWICRQNHLILNPPVRLKRPMPYQGEPRERVHGVLCRLSRNRIIERDEALAIVRKAVSKWSRAPSNTLRAFDYLRYGTPGRYWKGQWRNDWLEKYEDLTKLARENGWQWVDLEKRASDARRKKLAWIEREGESIAAARTVVTAINREVRERSKERRAA
jgi:hypothetical protein